MIILLFWAYEHINMLNWLVVPFLNCFFQGRGFWGCGNERTLFQVVAQAFWVPMDLPFSCLTKIKGPGSFVSGAFKLSPIKYHFLVSLYCNGSLESWFLHGIMYHQCRDCLYLAVVKLRWVAYKHELLMRFTFLHTPHWLNKRFSRRIGLFMARLYPPSN